MKTNPCFPLLFLASMLASCAAQQAPEVAPDAPSVQQTPPPLDEGTSSSVPANEAKPAVPDTKRELGDDFRLETGQAVSLGLDVGEIELVSVVSESIEPSPVDPDAYPAGSGTTMSLLLAGTPIEFSELSAGYGSSKIAYAGNLRAELISYDANQGSVVVHVDKLVPRKATLLQPSIRLQVREPLLIEAGVEVQFLGHSHKSISAGQTSPLIVYMRYESAGRIVEQQHNLFKPYSWVWERYRFEIVSHEYDEHMVLRISKLALEPLYQ